MNIFDSANLESGGEIDEKLPPIVFIHGWLDSWKSWSLILKSLNLQPKTRLLAVTLRGWGDSEKTGPYTIESYSNDLIQFLESKNIVQCVLCGHSMGTLISTLIAAKKPNLVKGLILCGAASKMDPEHVLGSTSLTLRALNQVIIETFPDGEISKAGEEFLDSFQCDDLRPLVQNGHLAEEFMVQVLQETLKATPRSFREAFQDMIDEDHTSLLGDISCPGLVIWGTEDVVFDRSEQMKLFSLLPNSQLTLREVDDGPHGVIWTHSQQCAELIEEWYRGQAELWCS
jgi:non-heme chloroperoxidase